MNFGNIDFQFKARYYKLGELNANTKQVWWVLHGYGQLAQFFVSGGMADGTQPHYFQRLAVVIVMALGGAWN